MNHVHPLMFCRKNMFSQRVFGRKVGERDELWWMRSRRDSAERASQARSVTVMRRVRYRSRDCHAALEVLEASSDGKKTSKECATRCTAIT